MNNNNNSNNYRELRIIKTFKKYIKSGQENGKNQQNLRKRDRESGKIKRMIQREKARMRKLIIFGGFGK